MQGFALTLCRVFALLASFVCASGFATSACAQSLPSGSSSLLEDELCRAADHEDREGGDFGAGSSGSGDCAEHDDDDDCQEEPPALVIDARREPAPWESGRRQRAFVGAPLISDHRTLEPRPPRAI
jgi:hypothetical protein